MACPICGAKCRCKRRGPGGLCCSCHRHKVKRVLRSDFSLELGVTLQEFQASLAKHVVVCEKCGGSIAHIVGAGVRAEICPKCEPERFADLTEEVRIADLTEEIQ